MTAERGEGEAPSIVSMEGDGRSPKKDGQSVPVGVGLPTIKIDGMTVGGAK